MNKKYFFLFIIILFILFFLKKEKSNVFKIIKNLNILSFEKNKSKALEVSESKISDIDFVSRNNISFKDVFEDQRYKSEITIKGRLYMPENVQGKIPLLIYIHGGECAIWEHDRKKLELVGSLGIAIFVFNSCNPRDINALHQTPSGVIPPASFLTDAIFALKKLSQHPEIDKNKIGVLGTSSGGTAAIMTGLKSIVSNFIDDDLKFKFHVAYYPFCFRLEELSFTDAPMLLLLGEKDNWAVPKECYIMVERLNSIKKNISIITYKDSTHAFTDLRSPFKLPGVRSREKCFFTLHKDGYLSLFNIEKNTIFNSTDKKSMSDFFQNSCGNDFIVVTGNEEAKEKSHLDMIEFIKLHTR